MGRDTRDLAASVVIRAAPERVWDVVADVRRTPEWSSECRLVLARARDWSTRSRVHVLEPGRTIGWTVRESGARWTYRLTPHPDGTLLDGQDDHGDELEEGIRTGLQRIRALVEG